MPTPWPAPKLHALANSPGILAIFASSDLCETFDLCILSEKGRAGKPEAKWKALARAVAVLTFELGELMWTTNNEGLSMRIILHGNLALVVFSESGHIAGRSLSRALERIFNVVL